MGGCEMNTPEFSGRDISERRSGRVGLRLQVLEPAIGPRSKLQRQGEELAKLSAQVSSSEPRSPVLPLRQRGLQSPSQDVDHSLGSKAPSSPAPSPL